MPTIRCSGRLMGGVCPGGVVCLSARRGVCPGGCLPGGVCPGGMCVSAKEGCLPRGCVCLGGCLSVCPWEGAHLPPVDRILETHLWKHYLSATSFADGNEPLGWCLNTYWYFISSRQMGIIWIWIQPVDTKPILVVQSLLDTVKLTIPQWSTGWLGTFDTILNFSFLIYISFSCHFVLVIIL